MKEFLYKSSFIRYYTALFNRNLYYVKFKMFWVYGIVAYFGMMFSAIWASFTAFAGFFLFLICAMHAAYRRTQPNLTGLMPLSSSKKIVYQFLSPLFTCLLVVIFILLSYFGMYLIAVIYCLFLDITIDHGYFETLGVILKANAEISGGYGIAFGAFFNVICYSAGMIFGFIKRKKFQFIFGAGFLAALHLSLYLISNNLKNDSYYNFFDRPSPFYGDNYANLSHPWVIILFAGIAAAAMLGYSVYFVIKRAGKKDF